VSKRDDIRTILADGEDTVTYQGTTYPCFLIQHDNVVPQTMGGQKLQRDTFVQVCAADFVGIKRDDPIQLDGEPWKVLRSNLVQDGGMLEIFLGRP